MIEITIRNNKCAKAVEILNALRKQADAKNVKGMARFGINPRNTLGVPMPALRSIAGSTGRNHALARELWASGIHEARILAGLVGDPGVMSGQEMEDWVGEFDSWDVCDQVCSNLFDKTPFAEPKAREWSGRKEEFVKRAGFVLMAALAVHDKKAGDSMFLRFLPLILREAADERNFVKKAVNWALRQIGKRNSRLNKKAVEIARKLAGAEAKAARWVGHDALRELTGQAVQSRLYK